MNFNIPIRKNKKLGKVIKNINENVELLQLWKCANINAVDRGGISDHGEVHIRIVANAALKILRLLTKAGIEPSVVKHHGMTVEDTEMIVVLSACLHDIGISIHRDDHERYSLFLAYPKSRELLGNVYAEPELTTIVSEVMHSIISHNAKETCLTIEAGVLKVSDALDMTEGRSRIPFEAGKINIHSVSARAIDSVDITKGDNKPIKLTISLSNSAGIFQIDELLRHKLGNSTIEEYIEIETKIEGETERRLIEIYIT